MTHLARDLHLTGTKKTFEWKNKAT